MMENNTSAQLIKVHGDFFCNPLRLALTGTHTQAVKMYSCVLYITATGPCTLIPSCPRELSLSWH